MTRLPDFDQPASYEIHIRGALDKHWMDWFGEFEIQARPDGVTVLTGHVADQPALHGLLARIRNLGLPLVAVFLIKECPECK